MKLAQKLGQLQPFIHVFPQEMHGPTCRFWANLTPCSLEGARVAGYTACALCGAGGTDAEAAALDAALVEVCGGATFSVWLRALHALVIWTAVRLS